MKALVFHGPGDIRCDDAPEPTLQAPDGALLRVTAALAHRRRRSRPGPPRRRGPLRRRRGHARRRHRARPRAERRAGRRRRHRGGRPRGDAGAAITLVRVGGRVSVVGVFVEPAMPFPIGFADVPRHLPPLLALVQSGRLEPRELITHRLGLRDGADAYRMFDERRDGCLKIVLDPRG